MGMGRWEQLMAVLERIACALERCAPVSAPVPELTEAQIEQRRKASLIAVERRKLAYAALNHSGTEKETSGIGPGTGKTNNQDLNRKTWEAYKQAYAKRYRVDPVRNQTVNSCISNFVKRIGENAPEILAFFVSHNDSFYVRGGHSVKLAVRDAESLATQWQRGRQVTGADARDTEKGQRVRSQLERLAAGEL